MKKLALILTVVSRFLLGIWRNYSLNMKGYDMEYCIKIGFIFAIVGVFLPFVTIMPVEAQDEPELPFAPELQDVIDQTFEQIDGVGVSVSLIVPGYAQWNGVGGVSHGTVPITADTIFHGGSTGKNFTAALVLQLVEEGILSLDDPLNAWLSDDYHYIDNTITIRQLLNHTSGIFQPNHHPDFYNTMFSDLSQTWTPEDILTTFLLEPYFPKGEGWAYSNANYILLGLIIEEATGSTVEDELRARFLEPLELSRTYLQNDNDIPEPIAHGWINIGYFAPEADSDEVIDEVVLSTPPMAWLRSMWTAATIVSTSEDLATWAHALYHEKSVLSQESLDQMLAFVPTTPDRPILAGYGLGAYLLNPELINGTVMYGHSGDALAYVSVSMYMPEYGVAFGMGVNIAEDALIGPLIAGIVDVITNNLEPIDPAE